MSSSSVLLDQELLQRNRLCSGRTLPAGQWFFHGGSAHGQPLLKGEASVQTDQAGLPAGGRGVLRRWHLEHLVRPGPHRGRPGHGQGTGGDCRCWGFPPFHFHPPILIHWVSTPAGQQQAGPPACPCAPPPSQGPPLGHPPAKGHQRLVWP